MKNKNKGYLAAFIGLLFLLSTYAGACEQPMSSLPEPVSAPVQPPHPAESLPPAQSPPADKNTTDEERWSEVETFTGKDNETTPPFHVSGSEWRINWTIDAEDPETSSLKLLIYLQDAPLLVWEKISHSGDGSGNATYYIPYENERDFYIKVIAQNLHSWTITVDDHANETSLSHIKITRIHYKGTVYPADPENDLCFERVEPDEYVIIKNMSNHFQDMDGWTLKNITKGYPLFIFPPGFLMFPGEIIRIYTNEFHLESGGLSFYYGIGNIWDNREPNTAVLYNAEGEEASRKSYTFSANN